MTTFLVDTNILIRFVTNDNPVLTDEAEKILEKNYCIITSPVFAEIIFVLTSFYEYSKKDVKQLIKFFNAENIRIEEREINLNALKIYCDSNLQYIDSWLTAKSLSTGLKIQTFDKKLLKYIAQN